jgi:putative aldouronate transport system permease protein
MIPRIVSFLGGEKANYIADPKNFTAIYVLSGLWQTTGYSAVIYLAALSSVDLELYESAVLDGANRLQKIVHIDLPSIKPTIVIMLILSIGNIMNIGFEKAYLLQNPLNLAASELIATYVYKIGLLRVQYSYSAAIGLFNSVINFVLLIIANSISKRLNAVGLW